MENPIIITKKFNETDPVPPGVDVSDYILPVTHPETGQVYRPLVKDLITVASKSDVIVGYKRSGNTIYDLIDQYTGEYFSVNKATAKPGGATITNADVDNIIYFKIGTEYFKRNFSAVYVDWYGVQPGSEVNYSAKFQKAIDTAALYKRKLVVPDGGFVVGGVNLKSNLTIEGSDNCVLKKPFLSDYCLGWGFDNVSDPTGANNISNLSINNVGFRGTSDVDGMYQFRHLLSLNGVENVTVTKCKFTAFNGDGIYIGSGIGIEKHNRKIKILGCDFDGVDKRNRQGISVIDGDNIKILRCNFKNCTAPDMPGAIDIEPDEFAFHVIKDIYIAENNFNNIGGNVGTISVNLPLSQSAMTVPISGITVVNNTIRNSTNGITLGGGASAAFSDVRHNVSVMHNRMFTLTGSSLSTYGLSGVEFIGNTVVDCAGYGYIGHPDGRKGYDISYEKNYFIGGGGPFAITIHNVKKFRSEKNNFVDIGLANGTYGVCIEGAANGNTDEMTLIGDNVYGSRTNIYTNKESTHTTNDSKNSFSKGLWEHNLVNGFTFSGSAVDKTFRSGLGEGTPSANLIGTYPAGISFTLINNPVPQADLGWPARQGVVTTYYDNQYNVDGVGYGWQEFQERVVDNSGSANNGYMRRWYRQPSNLTPGSDWGFWRELHLTDFGPTSFRPLSSTTALTIGKMYYDETLNKPVWWNGSVWKDATGATV